ncbi:putative S-adenosylmethionine-dependent methyltransferase [Natrialba magadii ATCC 43099]|uniref:Arsenite methyltransferase n=1 Tax=Natrialba magadii (strain ATCC 43099 / DSM 3394 / CCM 3739 / CIP 104546 / IAM 13178 / JCM 8861 / NBRC 102185 / NCIMB 2190 / MS3) TaxID=547559 RepID=D3SS52_NATMM|nr:methyltransferase domain-containing protein [Natrialba magadii]ADD04778.1 putative S-adenosylmethionine-dependent methyltransferase [Natrialba magadii ATCC 43099]ELY24944.1 type 11 methyltransferase [Natrialba magadii ATCC 43099]
MAYKLDERELEEKVTTLYQAVATEPDEEYHFEMGRPLAEQLGYPTADLDRIPERALASFAGVGYHIDMAGLRAGDSVLDLGSGSGTDAFVAALHVGDEGRVVGIDMTDEQLEGARAARDAAGMDTVSFERGYIEELPFGDDSFDVVLSNGVINLSAQKERVFEEVERVLAPNGRLALSDIVSREHMPERIKNDVDLWASCIGGAMQLDDYTDVIERPGIDIVVMRANPQYEFTSERAQGACQRYGVRSISIGARVNPHR